MAERLGCYIKRQACSDCDWFDMPFQSHLMFSVPPREVCPQCGGEVGFVVGRLVFSDERKGRFFKSTVTKVIGFKRGRGDGNNPPFGIDGRPCTRDGMQVIK